MWFRENARRIISKDGDSACSVGLTGSRFLVCISVGPSGFEQLWTFVKSGVLSEVSRGI